MKTSRVIIVLLITIAFHHPVLSQDAVAPEMISLSPGLVYGAHRILDLDGDGFPELLFVDRAGRVRVWRRGTKAGTMADALAGDLDLPHPNRTLLAVGDVIGDGRPPQLMVLSPDGPRLHLPMPKGGFSKEGRAVIPRRAPKFRLRVGSPRFADILEDLNGDGRPDLLVPHAEDFELWLNRGKDEATGRPAFVKTAEVRTDIKRTEVITGDALSDQLESTFRIPKLDFRDVNGDARPDLIVSDGDSRAFHLQRPDGSLPRDPDRVLDLDLFRDTTAAGDLRPGRTLAANKDATLQMQDLDSDDIPDYVISHRRKIWVFRGSKDGPNFTKPSDILKTSADVSALLVLPLDQDGRPDLLLVRVEVPDVASIIRGFFAEFEVGISAVGYAGRPGPKFTRTPKWKGDIAIILPAIKEVLKNPQALLSRWEETTSKFRPSVDGDFDGDGTADVAVLSEDGSRIEIWKVRGKREKEYNSAGIGSLFFDSKDREWSLDRILDWLGDIAKRRVDRLTGGRPPDSTVALRPADRYSLESIEAGDLDGDGRDEILVIYRDREAAGTAVLDLHSPK